MKHKKFYKRTEYVEEHPLCFDERIPNCPLHREGHFNSERCAEVRPTFRQRYWRHRLPTYSERYAWEGARKSCPFFRFYSGTSYNRLVMDDPPEAYCLYFGENEEIDIYDEQDRHRIWIKTGELPERDY